MIPYSGKGSRWIAVLAFSTSSVVFAQTIDIPLRNWTVPPYRPDGLTTMADITQGIGFVGMTPCRLVDTRQSGFPAGYGTPALVAGVPRNFDLNSDPLCTGIPASVDAYSLNVTVTNTSGVGFLIVYPQGQSQPITSSINFVAAQTLANAVIVPAGTGGGVTVVAGVSGTDLLIDINGYFTDTYNTAVQFVVSGNVSAQGAIAGTNSSTTANSYGIRGEVSGTGAGSAGIYGLASGTSGSRFGVLGKTSSTALDSAGVKGIDASGSPQNATTFAAAAVRGESLTNLGLLGISQSAAGVQGTLVNSSGAALAEGKLGVLVGGTYYGLFAATGDVGVTGTKSFVVPHPAEPGIVIRYVSLEGPEAGTYFRGQARIEGREAVIEVPEIFRLVTEEEGLSVQVTPMGRSANLWVEQLGLDRVVIRGTRDVEFFYTVNGLRKGYAEFQPMGEGSEFVPASASARLPEGLSPEAKRRLIANGTYNPDGTVNLETARRLGWTTTWSSHAESGSAPNR